MTRKLTSLIAATILAGSACVAAAQNVSPQIYFGIHGGRTLGTTDLSASGFELNGLGSEGYVAGAHAGLDLVIPNSHFFIGAFGGYDWQNTEFSMAAGSSTFAVKLGNSWYFGGRAGTVIHGGKLYVLGAYRQTDQDATMAALSTPTLKGFDLGIGAQVPIAKGVSLGVEGIATRYQREDVVISGSATGIDSQLHQLQALLRLNIELGGTEAAPRESIFDYGVPKTPQKTEPKTGSK